MGMQLESEKKTFTEICHECQEKPLWFQVKKESKENEEDDTTIV
jgi:hypothetical protein